MKVRTERVGSTFLLDLEGRLTAGADTHQLNEAIREIPLRDVGRVVFDFAKVEQLDCSGIGQLVQTCDPVRAAGRTLILINVERRVKRLLQMAGLLAVFEVLDSRQKAMPGCESEALQVCDRTSRPLERAERGSIARAVAPSPTPTF